MMVDLILPIGASIESLDAVAAMLRLPNHSPARAEEKIVLLYVVTPWLIYQVYLLLWQSTLHLAECLY